MKISENESEHNMKKNCEMCRQCQIHIFCHKVRIKLT